MKATLMYGAGDVRVEEVPDPTISDPTDALIRVTYACVCGSDLHPYHDLEATPEGRRMGHETIGAVEQVGEQVTTLRPGDTVIVPFAWSDGTCALPGRDHHVLRARRVLRRRTVGHAGRAAGRPAGRRDRGRDPGGDRRVVDAVAAGPVRRVPDGLPRGSAGRGGAG